MNGQRPPIVIAQWCSALGLLIVQYCASTGVAAEAMEPIWSGAMNGGQKNFFAPPVHPVHPTDPVGTFGTNGIDADTIDTGRVTAVGDGIPLPSDTGSITLFLRQVICEEYRCVTSNQRWVYDL